MPVARLALGIGAGETSALALVVVPVAVADGGRVLTGLVATGLIAGFVAAAALRGLGRITAVRPPEALAIATLNWVVLSLGGAAVHLAVGATTTPTVALLEGTAAATTTAMSALVPEDLPTALHLHRALTQWLAGLGALLLALVALPFAIGTADAGARVAARRGRRSLMSGRRKGVERVIALHLSLTMISMAAFALAGASTLDAIVHALTTASTGGLSTHTASLAALPPAAQWVGAVTMLMAGSGVVVLWWIVSRDTEALSRSRELRWYLAATAGAVSLVALGDDDIRGAAVLAASVVSTTGAAGSTDVAELGSGATVGLFLLAGIGAMAGSAGGGFGWMRLLHVIEYVRAELVRQLHPNAIRPVKVDGQVVSNRTVGATNGFVNIYVLVAGTGAVLVAVGEADLGPATALSISVAAITTSGLQLVDPVPVGDLGAFTHLVVCALMLLGRLAIAAVLLSLVDAYGRSRTAVAGRRRLR